MALRMEGDGRAPVPLAPDPQRDLLRHGAAREQRCGFLSHQLGNAPFETLYALAAAVDVASRPGALGERAERLGRRRLRRPRRYEARAARDDPLTFAVGHGREPTIVPWTSRRG